MKNLIFLATMIGLTGCYKKIPGNLNANQELTLKSKNGMVRLRSGHHNATLKVKSKRKMQLIVAGTKKKKFIFKLPRGMRFPGDNGRIRLRAQETGQPYDLSGNIVTRYDRSEIRHDTESCSREVRRETCRWEYRGGNEVCRRNSEGRRICRTTPRRRVRVCSPEWDTIWGERDITYRVTGKTTSYRVNFLNQEDQTVAASFNGRRFSSDRDVLSRGVCRIGYYDRPYWP